MTNSLKYSGKMITAVAFLALLVMACDPTRAQSIWPSDDVREKMAALQADRLKTIYFGANRAADCPQFTALMDSVAGRLRLLIPQHGIEQDTKLYLVKEEHSNAMIFVFEKWSCRYILTAKRFDVSGDGEVERAVVPKLLGPPLLHVVPDVPWIAEKTTDSHQGGFIRYNIPFDALDDDLTFSGLIYFAPANVTIYLVNAPDDLSLEAHKTATPHVLEMSIRNRKARVSLALTREVIANGTWTKLSGQ